MTTGLDPIAAAYDAALRHLLRPGMTVIDLGSPMATRAIRTCRMGAGRVHAVVSSGAAPLVHVLAERNGCGGRLDAIGDSEAHAMPAANLVMARMPGALPLHGASLLGLTALGPIGEQRPVVLPAAESLWMAPVHAPEAYALHAAPWSGEWDLTPASRRALNTWSRCDRPASALAGSPQPVGTVQYGAHPEPRLRTTAEWTVHHRETMHGFAVWSEVLVAEGLSLTGTPGPDAGSTLGQAFFPWLEPLVLDAGDRVSVTFRADALDTGGHWSWRTTVAFKAGGLRTFDQSTFLAEVGTIAPGGSSVGTPPRLNEDGARLSVVLEAKDSSASLDQAVAALLACEAGRSLSPDQARRWAEAVWRRYAPHDEDA